MYNRDYSKEIGLDTGEKIVSLRFSIPFLAVLAALCWFGARALVHHTAGGHSTATDPVGISTHS